MRPIFFVAMLLVSFVAVMFFVPSQPQWGYAGYYGPAKKCWHVRETSGKLCVYEDRR